MRRAGNGPGEHPELPVPKLIPLLVPGQEWRALWDVAHRRKGSGLPDRSDATLTFRDPWDVEHVAKSVLDWGPLWGRRHVTVYGLHHAARALRDIRDSVKGWGESAGGLRVYARDGDTRDRRMLEQIEGLQTEGGHEDAGGRQS